MDDLDETVLGRPGHEPGDFGTPEWEVNQRKAILSINEGVVEQLRAMKARRESEAEAAPPSSGEAAAKPYQPELGQAAFGQPWRSFETPDWLTALLTDIDSELRRVMWNTHQREYPSPFANTGESFKNDVFEAHAYEWDDRPQPFNFKWRDFEVSWYKYLGRGSSMNRDITPDEAVVLHRDCIESLRAMDREVGP